MERTTAIQHTKNNPYEIRWRYDFDKSLISVCNINGGDYDKENLSADDKANIEDEFAYLKSLTDFFNAIEMTDKQKKELTADTDNPLFIDYVNVGWINEDGNTVSYKQYWETSNGFKSFDCEGNDACLSENGMFPFYNDTFPCMTRIIECGNTTCDFRA